MKEQTGTVVTFRDGTTKVYDGEVDIKWGERCVVVSRQEHFEVCEHVTKLFSRKVEVRSEPRTKWRDIACFSVDIVLSIEAMFDLFIKPSE